MNILLLGFGSRGDVQPLIALGRGLVSAGYDVTLAAGKDFKDFVEDGGLTFAPFTTSMYELMNSDEGKEWTNNSNGSLDEAKNMRKMLALAADDVHADMIRLVQPADVIVSGFPMFITAQTIAEKYNKRHITLQLVPFNPTREGRATIQPVFPTKQSRVNRFTGYVGQYFTYWIFKEVGNPFREQLGLAPMSFADYRRAYNKEVPVIYGLSKHLITEPDDWGDNTFITGYWYQDAPSDWEASPELLAFLANGDKPIYLGFGSMSSQNPEATTQLMVDALVQAGKRGIIYSGWAGLKMESLPESIFLLDGAPHDWLFPQMAGLVHHGGAGTTAVGLRAGVPTTVISHMADQPYWGRRVHELGVGSEPIARKDLTVDKLANAICHMTDNPDIQQNATALSQKIAQEDGVAEAVRVFDKLLR